MRKVLDHAEPKPTGRAKDFASVRKFKEHESVPVMIGGVELGRIRVSDLLPPA